jgi:hypothetical protein
MADLWTTFSTGLRVDADLSGAEVMANIKKNLTRAQLANHLVINGAYDLAPTDVGISLSQGDISTIKIAYLEADFDGMGYKFIGASYTILSQAIPDSPAVALLMTDGGAGIVISAGGTTGGRLKYTLVGV